MHTFTNNKLLSSGPGKNAGAILRDLLLKEYAQGALSATLLCVICFFITACGGIGVEDLAVKPGTGSQGGNYQKRLDTALGLSEVEKNFYFLQIPTWDKARDVRSACVNQSGL